MPVWDPTQQQFAEADTLFRPTLTNLATINAEGGFLQGANEPQANLVSRYDFGAGKFTPAVRAKAGQANYVFYPIDGLVAGDEFTLEYWQKLDIAWSAYNAGKALFCLQGSFGANYLQILNMFNGTATTYVGTMANIPARAWTSAWSASVATLGLVDFAWNSFAVTLKAGTMLILINGVVKGTITGVNYLPQWADSTREEGVLLGGDFGNQNNVWTSDVRISHTQRVLGQSVTLRPVTSTMAVNATATSGAVPAGFSGSLKISRYDPAWPQLPVSTSAQTIADGSASLAVVRENCPMTEVPIKAGGTDGTHPHAGASGQFSYDWQVVDRSLQWWTDRGLEIYTGADPCPQILGGNVTPDVTHPLMGGTWSNAVPNSFANFATMIADMVARGNATGRHISRMGNWNEPDLGSAFWSGTIQQMVDLWHAVVTAVKAQDSTVKCGAGECSNIQAVSWIDAFMAKKQAAGTAMDFFSLHDYSGSLHSIDQAVGHVGRYATDHGLSTPPVVIGEYNWTDINDETGYERFRGGYWHVRAINAAYALSYLLHGIDVGNVERMTYAHTGPAYNTIRANTKYSSMILVGDNNEHWATFNALKGFKLAANGRDILTTTKTLAPGVYGLATKDPAATKYGLLFSNWGWANRNNRTVNVTISNLPAGNYTLTRYLVDETHSSRWDMFADGAAGAPYDALAVVETRTDTAANLSSLSVTLPRWSSTFITIEPSGGPPPGGPVALTGTSNGSSTTTGNLSGGSLPPAPPTPATQGAQPGLMRLGLARLGQKTQAATGGSVTLTGTSAGSSTSSGTLTVGGTTLAGTSVGTSTSSGSLRFGWGLVGTSAGGSSTSGALTGGTAPSSTLTSQLGTTDSWLGNIALGYAAAAATVVPLTGTSAGSSTSAGNLGVTRRPTGTSAGTSTSTGTLRVTRGLTGTSTGTSTSTGSISGGSVFLTGTSVGSSTTTGYFPGVRALGNLIVTTVTTMRVAGLVHTRLVETLTIRGRLIVETEALVHSRATSDLTVVRSLTPGALDHNRQLGAASVNLRILATPSLSR